MLLLTCWSRACECSCLPGGAGRAVDAAVDLLEQSMRTQALSWRSRARSLGKAGSADAASQHADQAQQARAAQLCLAAAQLAEQGGVAQLCLGSCWRTLAAAQAGFLPALNRRDRRLDSLAPW